MLPTLVCSCVSLCLCGGQELENDKSLDEAYVCLKLAYEFNVSRNIVEYFSAALLPSYSISPSIVQLFMEIMPSEWVVVGVAWCGLGKGWLL